MRKTELLVFKVALARLRQVNELLNDTDAGVCLIHLDACIAALESRTAEEARPNAARPPGTC